MGNTLANQFEHDLKRRVSVLEQGLSQLGQGIILLSKLGHVLFVTDVADSMLQQHDGLTIVEGVLVGILPQDDERLQYMKTATLKESTQEQSYKSFYIHRNNQKKPYLLLISKMGSNLFPFCTMSLEAPQQPPGIFLSSFSHLCH